MIVDTIEGLKSTNVQYSMEIIANENVCHNLPEKRDLIIINIVHGNIITMKPRYSVNTLDSRL